MHEPLTHHTRERHRLRTMHHSVSASCGRFTNRRATVEKIANVDLDSPMTVCIQVVRALRRFLLVAAAWLLLLVSIASVAQAETVDVFNIVDAETGRPIAWQNDKYPEAWVRYGSPTQTHLFYGVTSHLYLGALEEDIAQKSISPGLTFTASGSNQRLRVEAWCCTQGRLMDARTKAPNSEAIKKLLFQFAPIGVDPKASIYPRFSDHCLSLHVPAVLVERNADEIQWAKFFAIAHAQTTPRPTCDDHPEFTIYSYSGIAATLNDEQVLVRLSDWNGSSHWLAVDRKTGSLTRQPDGVVAIDVSVAAALFRKFRHRAAKTCTAAGRSRSLLAEKKRAEDECYAQFQKQLSVEVFQRFFGRVTEITE